MGRHLLVGLLALALGCAQVQAKTVFAHFMLSNTAGFSVSDYQHEIVLAQEAHIDGFAVNFAMNEETTDKNLPLFFTAAESKGFTLFLSFDYAGNVSWPKATVSSMIKKYAVSSAYYRRNLQPLVSTFEGPKSAPDWPAIKQETNCFFIPSFSSLGAKKAVALGVADGLFSWAGWPEGPNPKNTEVDASYLDFMNGMPYMMPVSPWFYTNMPGFKKNWLWRGDHMWFDRWTHVWYLQPEFVQIISWNDYGESHYIGPLDERQYSAFAQDKGNSPFNYVRDMPHDGWRDMLPYVIDTYKNNVSTVNRETLTAWYRLNPGSACSTGGTTGNTASQQQTEYSPAVISEDRVFFSALLGSKASATVKIGGTTQSVTWETIPDGEVGVYHGSVPFNGATGQVVVTLSRGGPSSIVVTGASITTDCGKNNGLNNWNAWVGSTKAPSTISVKPPRTLAQQTCVSGIGMKDFGSAHENFEGVCSFSCHYGYCPRGPCTCSKMGLKVPDPKSLNIDAWPGAGMTCTWEGLCSFSCNHDYCPAPVCSTDPSLKGKCVIPQPLPEPDPDEDPTEQGCVSGEGDGNFMGLCDYSCGRGFCPEPCDCLARGDVDVPPAINPIGYPLPGLGDDYIELCKFVCSRGDYCPDTACTRDDPNSPADPYEPNPDDDIPLTPCLYSPTTMDEMINLDYFNDLPDHCVTQYMVPVLQSIFENSTARYNEAMENGYDKYFGVYADYLVSQKWTALEKLVKERGDEFFDCNIWQEYACCLSCEFERLSCYGCIEVCHPENAYDLGHEWYLQDQPCPPDYSQRGIGTASEQSIFWSFKDDGAKDNFYETANGEIGAPKEKFRIADHLLISTPSPGCARDYAYNGWDDMSEGCQQTGWWSDFPYPFDFVAEDVVNPKEVVEETIKMAGDLQTTISEYGLAIMAGDFDYDGNDLVDALILPVFMIQEAVGYMETAAEIGKEIDDANRDAFIYNLVSALLIVVGLAGVPLAEAGMVVLGRILVGLAELGNTGIGLQAVIATPESAPLLIFGLVMSGVGIRDVTRVAKAANLRRGMKAEEIADFSKEASRLADYVSDWNVKPARPDMCKWA